VEHVLLETPYAVRFAYSSEPFARTAPPTIT